MLYSCITTLYLIFIVLLVYRAEPTKEMRAAMKVLNDALQKSPTGNLQQHLKNANNIVQQEWFKVSLKYTLYFCIIKIH